MKYEMIFGNKIYFEHQENEYVVAIQIDHDDDSFEIQFDTDYPSKLKRNETIVAMHRIIKEPKRWTWEDKKVGLLPEVGVRVMVSKSESAVITAYDSIQNVFSVQCKNQALYILKITEMLPIETPAEKAQREEDEFIRSLSGTDIHYGTGTVKELFDQGARAAYRKLKGGE